MTAHELKQITESKRKFNKAISPAIEKMDTPSIFDRDATLDDNCLTIYDQQHYGRTFSVETDGIYTVRLGTFHDMDRGMLGESTISCTIPRKPAYERSISAVFDIPEASARFMDVVTLKSTHPFTVTLIEDTIVLDRHQRSLSVLMNYNLEATDDAMIIRIKPRENVPDQYRIHFDILRIQIQVAFKK